MAGGRIYSVKMTCTGQSCTHGMSMTFSPRGRPPRSTCFAGSRTSSRCPAYRRQRKINRAPPAGGSDFHPLVGQVGLIRFWAGLGFKVRANHLPCSKWLHCQKQNSKSKFSQFNSISSFMVNGHSTGRLPVDNAWDRRKWTWSTGTCSDPSIYQKVG